MTNSDQKQLWIDSFLVTLFTFAFLGLSYLAFKKLPLNYKMLNPIKETMKDFDYTDLHYSQMEAKRNNLIDTNIVIVNVGHLDRLALSQLIKLVDEAKPKVVGLDLFFEDFRQTKADTLLKESLANCDNLVNAYYLNPSGDHIKNHDFFGDLNEGYGNLFEKGSVSVIRNFAAFTKYEENKYPSFATQIVKIADEKSYKQLAKRNHKKEIINYIGNFDSFITLEGQTMLEQSFNAKTIRDKIVLLGFLGNTLEDQNSLEDFHFTPLNEKISGRAKPDMRGVLIHANILHTILQNDYVNKLSTVFTWLIAFIVGLFMNRLMIKSYMLNYRWFHFFAKVSQLILMILTLFIVFWLYGKCAIKFESLPIFAVVILSVDLLYFYDPIVKILHNRGWIKNSFFLKAH